MQSIIQFGYPFTPSYVGDIPFVTFLFSLCPWALLSKGFNDLGLAAAGTNPGLGWNQRTRYISLPMLLNQASQLSFPILLCPSALLGINNLGLAAAGTNLGLGWNQHTRW